MKSKELACWGTFPIPEDTLGASESFFYWTFCKLSSPAEEKQAKRPHAAMRAKGREIYAMCSGCNASTAMWPRHPRLDMSLWNNWSRHRVTSFQSTSCIILGFSLVAIWLQGCSQTYSSGVFKFRFMHCFGHKNPTKKVSVALCGHTVDRSSFPCYWVNTCVETASEKHMIPPACCIVGHKFTDRETANLEHEFSLFWYIGRHVIF